MTRIPPTMTAIGSFAAKPIDDDEALQDVTVELPELRSRDVLVRVLAVSATSRFAPDCSRRRHLPFSGTTPRESWKLLGRKWKHCPSVTRSGLPATSHARAATPSSRP
jgi:hypothetical protein